MLFLGVDTSAYTSSVALVDHEKNLIWETRRILEVPDGERGLAQSEALFHHIRNMPECIAMVPKPLWKEVGGIGVSAVPRPVEKSYMPVFLAGIAIASSLASALDVPLVKTTHQEGHLAAGMASANSLTATDFLAVHLSGGTTEVLKVKKSDPGKIDVAILGATTDLHAGQFVDRVGVSLGLSFPAGKELEKLALRAAPGSSSLLPSSVKGYDMSFSGVEAAAQRMIKDQKRPADIAQAVQGCLVRTLDKVLKTAVADTGLTDILIVGGVASNSFIRNELTKKMHAQADLHWAKTEWSSDNAVGVALLTRETLLP